LSFRSVKAFTIARKENQIIVRTDFGEKGSVIVFQLITEGKLSQGYGESGLYGKRYDPVAVFNCIEFGKLGYFQEI